MSEKTLEITRDIAVAYLQENRIPQADLGNVVSDIFDTISKLSGIGPGQTSEDLKPAVPIKKSITPDHLICLEDGQKFKSLKRHLRTHYELSPEQYREKWNLPHDYPMVAPNYAAQRSRLAKEMGLGRQA